MRFHVGTDVGGTFTDLWAIRDDGRTEVVKTPTTPDIISGLVTALHLVADRYGLPADKFCTAVERLGHGTTAGLNALLTGQVSSAGLITTAGFVDTLEIGRLKRQVAGLTELEISDYLQRGRWAPVIPRERIAGVPERVDRRGRVVEQLDEEVARQAIRQLLDAGVEAIGVCTLWSVVQPVHELRIRDLVAEAAPDVFVTLSHEAAPGLGEYGRMSTTAVNAALGPILSEYFSKLDTALAGEGVRVPATVMTGTGGAMTTAEVTRVPAAALISGPAAGVVSCQRVAAEIGHQRVLTIDMGGTSFDVGAVVDGVPLMRSELTVAGADVRSPSVDVATIGAGGGSIAAVRQGSLQVGPHSAGSTPGPACYGRGGTHPTVTDADLLLGVIGLEDFAGGQLELDPEAAVDAVRREIADPLSLDVITAAWGIRQVLDSRMADLLRSVTIERGHDPREFVMVANGGQGPAHAWALARELGIGTVVITPTATVQSAVGTGTSDLRRSSEQPAYVRISGHGDATEAHAGLLNAAAAAVAERAGGPLRDALGSDAVEVSLTVAVRFRGQAHHLDVPLDNPLTDAGVLEVLLDRFEREYEALFGAGSAFREAGFELLSVRAVATGRLRALAAPQPADVLVPAGTRAVVFDDPTNPVPTPVYRASLPAPGQALDGPALVVYPGQTGVVPPGARAEFDRLGNLVMDLTAGAADQTA